jgi:diguanylate cyclase (GGDEF)-like protein
MPRITNRVFADLAIWMTSFGVVVGLVFPPFCIWLGLPVGAILTPSFMIAALLAGLLVGGVNYALARLIVASRLQRLANHMNKVQRQMVQGTRTGDWGDCDPTECALPVDSDDEVGRSAAAFNVLIATLARSHELESATRRFGLVVSGHLDLDVLSREALAAVLSDTSATAGVLLLERGEGLEVLTASGISDPDAVAQNRQVVDAMRARKISRLSVDAESVVLDSVLLEQQASEVAIVPLSFKSVPVGALVLASTNPLSPTDDVLLRHYQADLSLGLSNAISHDRLERLAAVDPLTDAYNRRFGLVRLQEEFGRALRVEGPLGLLMLDLDHFKAVNDTFGHLAGDRVLRAVARSVRHVLREGDILVRYGGEEFLVVTPGASASDLAELGERLRRAVAATVVPEHDARISVTVSVGAASFPEHDVGTASELVQAADEALYGAKRNGRDRVVLAASAIDNRLATGAR